MVFTDEELSKWKVEDLKSFLLARGVPLSSGGCRKTQLIEKVIFAEKLSLPVLPLYRSVCLLTELPRIHRE